MSASQSNPSLREKAAEGIFEVFGRRFGRPLIGNANFAACEAEKYIRNLPRGTFSDESDAESASAEGK